MSFVDELYGKINNAEQNTQENEKKRIASMVKEFVAYIKDECRKSPKSKKLSGYIYNSLDVDYAFNRFDLQEDLPTCDIREMNRNNRRDRKTLVINLGIKNIRIYRPVLCFDSYEYASYFSEQLKIELEKLGFKKYDVSVVKIEDLYLVTKSKQGFFRDSIKYSLGTSGYTYVIYLNIRW